MSKVTTVIVTHDMFCNSPWGLCSWTVMIRCSPLGFFFLISRKAATHQALAYGIHYFGLPGSHKVVTAFKDCMILWSRQVIYSLIYEQESGCETSECDKVSVKNLQQHESCTLKSVFGSFCSLCIQRHFKTVHNSPKKLNLAFEIWLYDFLLHMMDIS